MQSETTEAFRFIVVCCHSDLLMRSRGERSSGVYFLRSVGIMTPSVKSLRLFVFGATAPPPPVGQGLCIPEGSKSHTPTPHNR